MDSTISQLQSDASVISTIGPIDISGDSSSSSSSTGTSTNSSSGSGLQFNSGSVPARGSEYIKDALWHCRRDNYLATEVKTAAPQKLQWLLIEAALRSANRAGEYWRQGRDDMAIGRIVHAQGVLAEMLGCIDQDAGGKLAERVFGLYEFIFRLLVQAGHRHDETCLADAVRLLEIERETWRQLCAKIATDNSRSRPAAPLGRFAAPVDFESADFGSGISLEA